MSNQNQCAIVPLSLLTISSLCMRYWGVNSLHVAWWVLHVVLCLRSLHLFVISRNLINMCLFCFVFVFLLFFIFNKSTHWSLYFFFIFCFFSKLFVIYWSSDQISLIQKNGGHLYWRRCILSLILVKANYFTIFLIEAIPTCVFHDQDKYKAFLEHVSFSLTLQFIVVPGLVHMYMDRWEGRSDGVQFFFCIEGV